jgi:hypothetical protein
VIYASKNGDWNLDKSAALVLEADVGSLGVSLEDLFYFLEVEICKEILKNWKDWRNGREPSESERMKAILYYAENDSFLDDRTGS